MQRLPADPTPNKSPVEIQFQKAEPQHGPIRTCAMCKGLVFHYEAVLLPCNHNYCRSCITQLILQDAREGCCFRRFPILTLDDKLTPTQMRLYQNEAEYLNGPKLYCSYPDCGMQFHPDDPGLRTASRGIICKACGYATCKRCKGPSKEGFGCQSYYGYEHMWLRRCYQCEKTGLVQQPRRPATMICSCGARFCYTCGLPSCNCGLYQEYNNNLTARAIYDMTQGVSAQMTLEEFFRMHYRNMQDRFLANPLLCQHDGGVHPLLGRSVAAPDGRPLQAQFGCRRCHRVQYHRVLQCSLCSQVFCNQCSPVEGIGRTPPLAVAEEMQTLRELVYKKA